MKAVILVGGQGSRMRPLTVHTPKPLLPLVNRPHLDHVFAFLHGHGVTDVILAVQYHAEAFAARYGDGASQGIHLTVVREDEPRGTAGAVQNVAAHLTRGETVLVFNGDILTDLDLAAMLAFHRTHRAVCTISLTPVADPSAYGVVEQEPDGRVIRFIEKPKREEAPSNLINAGTYILEPQVLDLIPPDTHYMFEYGVFPSVLQSGLPLYVYASDAYWIDIGTPEKYIQAHRDLLQGRMHGGLAPALAGDPTPAALAGAIWTGTGVEIAPTAELTGPLVIGDGCRIEHGTRLVGPAVLGAGCHVAAQATVKDAVLWDRVEIGAETLVQTAVLAHGVTVAPEAQIGGGALVADGCQIAAHNQLTNGIRLGPGLVVPERAITFK